MKRVFQAMRQDKRRDRIWFIQSKNPSCLKQYLKLLPENTFLLTTLETNRDENYNDEISKAPRPRKRYKDFLNLKWDKKIVTVEPIMDFDLDIFSSWLISIKPKAVFIGYNSRPKVVSLPEPTWSKFLALWRTLRRSRIKVLPKETRKAHVPKRAYWEFES